VATDGVEETVTPSTVLAAAAEESDVVSVFWMDVAWVLEVVSMVIVTCTDAAATATVTADSATPASLAAFVLTVAWSVASKSETSPGEVKVTTTSGGLAVGAVTVGDPVVGETVGEAVVGETVGEVVGVGAATVHESISKVPRFSDV
jgi:hypothetical protein